MGVTAWFRSLARCENGGSIVEYVGVSGLALLVTGWIIVTISAQRFTIGGAMANIHARQIVSFENGLGGTANTNAQLYPHVTPPTVPVISIPQLVGSEQASSWWDWLWQERTWTWYAELMEKWRNSGWFGWLTATIFGFLVDLVAGISSDGTFSWGWVILSLISTVASIFGVGLLAKIPGLAKYLKLIIPWLDDLERMIPGLAKLTVWFDDPGKWIWKNDDRIKEILQGKWGTWAKEVLTSLAPYIKKWTPRRFFLSVENFVRNVGLASIPEGEGASGESASAHETVLQVVGNAARGVEADQVLPQRYRLEPPRGDTVTGIRDTQAGRVSRTTGRPVGAPVIRIDRPHRGAQHPHVNIKTLKPDPHYRISPGILRAAGGLARGLEAVGRVARPVAIITDTVRLSVAISEDEGIGHNTVRTAASVAGGWAGAFAGAWAGAKAGAALGGLLGSVIPVLGSAAGAAIGGLLGGLIGGIAGSFFGSWAGESAADAIMER